MPEKIKLQRNAPFGKLDLNTELSVANDLGSIDDPRFSELVNAGETPQRAIEKINEGLPFNRLKYTPKKTQVYKNPLEQAQALYNEGLDFQSPEDIDADYERSWGPVDTYDKYQSYLKWKKEGK